MSFFKSLKVEKPIKGITAYSAFSGVQLRSGKVFCNIVKSSPLPELTGRARSLLRVAPACVASKKKSKIMGNNRFFSVIKMLVKKVENMGTINVTEIGRDF